jgi:hypothetical protein
LSLVFLLVAQFLPWQLLLLFFERLFMNELQVSNTALANQGGGRMAVADIIQHVAVVQEVMRAVMKETVHYGVIPGTDKPTLYKSGAEVLCMVFRIADTYAIEDLSTSESVRYRVTCSGTHQTTGTMLGTGMGEASSGEEKYKWRKAYDDEFEATPENLRRIKLGKYKTKQVRTEPADLANTILKMANKRAKMAMVLNVTAASDCFAQDLEDMDDALRDHLTRRGEDSPSDPTKSATTLPGYTDEQMVENAKVWQKVVNKGKPVGEVLATVKTVASLTSEQEALILSLKPQAADSPKVGPSDSFIQ